ncbi:cache domain-containing sensor histidine kinase [Paenibacillus soyae]|uniref:histidine kinase n=1 Tax=Paenibacillus soyae TaxID=2969249 RepID=A0A9X2MUI1_9BACL|nr:sensor histidine kinase [Paenibacillus soyae]MCR2806071.1 sensor histidine kinase [Paenibacillus soyae]
MSLRRVFSRAGGAIGSLRMERKLFLVFLVLISLPLSFIGYITYSNYSASIEEKTTVFSATMQEAMMARIDDYIEDMIRISSIPAYQDDIKQNLIRSNRYYERMGEAQGDDESTFIPEDFNLLLSIQRGIEDNVSFINMIKRGSNTVYVFDQYGNGYYSTVSGNIRLDIKESYEFWSEQLEASSGEEMIFGTQKYISNLQSEKFAFTVARKVIDKSLQPIGLIAVDANVSVVEDGIGELDTATKGSSIIFDEAGTVIYDSTGERTAAGIGDDPVIKRAKGIKGSFYEKLDGVNRLYIYSTSSKTGWKIMTAIPESELTRDAVIIRRVTWIATIVTLLVALLLSFILSYALTNPLRRMTKLMRNVQEGDFAVQFPVKYRDEVGQLGNQFNRMIVRIDQLIRDIYEMETKKKEAELQALQNQINPHFMYNTLETIRMTAEINDDTDAADMIAILGRLLRYSISDLHEEVTLSDEAGHVRHYVELLNYRYPGRFALTVDIPEHMTRYAMIKLALQPIVENAIYHGLDETKQVMHIRIAAETRGHEAVVTIRDDGIGMNEEELERLNRSLAGLDGAGKIRNEKGGGIGLRNINERLKLHYGAGYGIQASSRPGEGAEITILLPAGKGRQS